MASTVRKILGFDIRREGHENISTVLIDDKKSRFDELKDYFGLVALPGSVATVASVALESLELVDAPEIATHAEEVEADLPNF